MLRVYEYSSRILKYIYMCMQEKIHNNSDEFKHMIQVFLLHMQVHVCQGFEVEA